MFLDSENGEGAVIPAPVLVIVLLTYKRTDMARTTIHYASQNIDYPKSRRVWYVSDDGSPSAHINALREQIYENGETIYEFDSHKYHPGTPFCGRGWNQALYKSHTLSDYILWLEDDWRLDRELDLRPYVRLLMERSDVGMVSMRTLSVGNNVHTVGYRGIHYLRYDRTTPSAYSGNPLLRHRRYTEFYSAFSENRSPGDIEIDYDERYRSRPGPDIWRPVDIGGWGIWGHIGNERTW